MAAISTRLTVVPEFDVRLADEILVDAIADRDPDALDQAYRQHANRVHALARHFCGNARAEDLTQEIFLRLWMEPHRYDAERGSLRSFLLVQAHRRALDILRSDTARTRRETAENRCRPVEPPDTEDLALTLIERAEIRELLSVLPPNERDPIVLAYFGGHCYHDVARLLGAPEGTVKTRIRRGLQRMREHGLWLLDLPEA